jgi:hypothetical protein
MLEQREVMVEEQQGALRNILATHAIELRDNEERIRAREDEVLALHHQLRAAMLNIKQLKDEHRFLPMNHQLSSLLC